MTSDEREGIKAEGRQRFHENAYRAILTHARQGMVIYVPEGDGDDPTRRPSFHDGTYDYLGRIGIQELPPRGFGEGIDRQGPIGRSADRAACAPHGGRPARNTGADDCSDY